MLHRLGREPGCSADPRAGGDHGVAGSHGLGLSRLSLPFLFGTVFTAGRGRAVLYFFIFARLGLANWWLGGALGVVHGLQPASWV